MKSIAASTDVRSSFSFFAETVRSEHGISANSSVFSFFSYDSNMVCTNAPLIPNELIPATKGESSSFFHSASERTTSSLFQSISGLSCLMLMLGGII